MSTKSKSASRLKVRPEPTPQLAFAPCLSPGIHDAYERLFEAADKLANGKDAYSDEAAAVLPELLTAAAELARLIGFEPASAGKAVSA